MWKLNIDVYSHFNGVHAELKKKSYGVIKKICKNCVIS